MLVRLRSIAMWGYIAASVPVFFVGALAIWLATAPFDRQRRLLHRYSCLWAAHYVWLSPFWFVTVIGRDRVEEHPPYVIVSNHQSLGDILVLFSLHRHFKWISKAAVFKVPFLGWNMRLNDYVPIVRGDSGSIEKMMTHCRSHLERGSSILMFPEGTRSMDGRLRPFKHGAFTLAVEAGVPVLPIVVEGTRDALPKQGFLFKKVAHMTVEVLEPIQPGTDPQALRDAVRQRLARRLAVLRGLAPEDVVQRLAEPAAPRVAQPQSS
jgi:1-acyl-sn-glycerol-3-phosphate acyltransferase